MSASKTLLRSDSGKVFGIGTDSLVMTVPDVTAHPDGLEYTFINVGTAGNNIITIATASTGDFIAGTITLAASIVTKDGTVNKDLINTKGSATLGDMVTIVSDGVDGYFITAATGIWASE